MSLKHAILGFLSYQPFSGYDLKKAFDRSVRHFWPANQSQIYRTLARITDQGWAEVEIIQQTDRPDRKEYAKLLGEKAGVDAPSPVTRHADRSTRLAISSTAVASLLILARPTAATLFLPLSTRRATR